VARGGVLSGGFAPLPGAGTGQGERGHALHADPLPGQALASAEEAGIEEEGRRLPGFILGDAGARNARVEVSRPA
jgi:hypothetical protein